MNMFIVSMLKNCKKKNESNNWSPYWIIVLNTNKYFKIGKCAVGNCRLHEDMYICSYKCKLLLQYISFPTTGCKE